MPHLRVRFFLKLFFLFLTHSFGLLLYVKGFKNNMPTDARQSQEQKSVLSRRRGILKSIQQRKSARERERERKGEETEESQGQA